MMEKAWFTGIVYPKTTIPQENASSAVFLTNLDIGQFLDSTEVLPILQVLKWVSNLGLVNFIQIYV